MDNNGELECTELGTLLQKLREFGGSNVAMPGLAEVLSRWDVDESGSIDLFEFLHMLCEVAPKTDQRPSPNADVQFQEPFVALLPPGSTEILSTLKTLSLSKHNQTVAQDTKNLLVLLLIRENFSEFASHSGDADDEILGRAELRDLLKVRRDLSNP